VRVTISRGELARIIAKVSRAVERPYQELLDDLPGQARLNVDETGHKQNGDRQWTWCFRAGLYTLFKIDPTRSADVLIEVLGRSSTGCWVRLLLVLPSLPARVRRAAPVLPGASDPRCEVPDHAARCAGPCYGERLREALRELFAVIHRREALTAEAFGRRLEAARAEVLRCGTSDVPETKHSRNLAKRFEAHGESYFRFVTMPGWSRRTTWRSKRSGSW
jgi:hypothetical protein